MDRRKWIAVAVSGLGGFIAALFVSSRRADAASTRLDADTLIYTLQVGRPEDKEFIKRLVAMMDSGELPRSIVDKCYLWARRKRKNKFHHFKRAVIYLAAKKGITVK